MTESRKIKDRMSLTRPAEDEESCWAGFFFVTVIIYTTKYEIILDKYIVC